MFMKIGESSHLPGPKKGVSEDLLPGYQPVTFPTENHVQISKVHQFSNARNFYLPSRTMKKINKMKFFAFFTHLVIPLEKIKYLASLME